MSEGMRILIVKLSAIGDVIHGMPAACAIKKKYPDAYLGWVVEKTASPLLQNHPAIDWLKVVPRKWLKSFSTVMELRREMREQNFDIAVDLQGLSKSAIVSWLSGAKRRIGFGGAEGREISTWLNNELVRSEKAHVIDKNLDLLAPLGITEPAVEFGLEPDGEESAKAEASLRDININVPFAVVNPGAGWPSKRWPLARYAEIARRMHKDFKIPSVVVWAGEEEKAWALEIVAGAEGAAVMGPPTTLRELAALLKKAAIFVGSDTGPLHIATAVGTPCVGLYGPMPWERNGPYGDGHVAIQKMRIDGTSRERRNATKESMDAISADDVFEGCAKIVKGKNGEC
ncbi:MAG: glycosyltransferase family 9 protein [Planctomycetes bacterium]|nr:glycosyltransferase family 9 protein [Planctomycetota bacterium]